VPSPGTNPETPIRKFTRQDFRADPDRNVLICPAEQELSFIGQYQTENGQGAYRLYGRSDCGGCRLKPQCTTGTGRRVKVPVHSKVDSQPTDPPAAIARPAERTTTKDKEIDAANGEHPRGPRASITEPEAVMMLATSEKRWEPSYNADLTVTRHGVIVSQFLTKDPTDFHHFGPALRAVLASVGKPESWVGDGHYGTQANVLLADREGVFLYAPLMGSSKDQNSETPATLLQQGSDSPEQSSNVGSHHSPEWFARHHFHRDPERDVMICPANQELRLIGVYPIKKPAYRVYGRSDCCDCSLKSRCTDGKGRRLKIIDRCREQRTESRAGYGTGVNAAQDRGLLLQAHAARMKEVGDAVLRFRRETVQPANAHLKQHGLGRFHVRGLARCAAILTLACIAHNLTKWKAREAARLMKAIA
jgi:hypothetical protein